MATHLAIPCGEGRRGSSAAQLATACSTPGSPTWPPVPTDTGIRHEPTRRTKSAARADCGAIVSALAPPRGLLKGALGRTRSVEKCDRRLGHKLRCLCVV